MQALQDLSLDSSTFYDRAAATKWIMERQDTDGSWKEEPLRDGQEANYGVGLTADVIIALGCKGLGNKKYSTRNLNLFSFDYLIGAIRALQCDNVIRDTNGNGENGDNGNDKVPLLPGLPVKDEETDQKNISFTYTLWLESNISAVHSLTMMALKNTSFFKAMTIAAETDKT
jgi:gastric intrinsic factor